MFRKIDDFTEVWTKESEATQKQMNQLTDKSLSQSVADGYRTLGRLAWHIVTTIPEMMPLTGLKVSSVDPKAPVPNTAAEIKKAYATVSKDVLEQVKANWKDADLEVKDDLYGQKWKRGRTLGILVDHEIHHRGQMTVLMRQAGLKVVGIYGPAKEEWADFGGQPPEV